LPDKNCPSPPFRPSYMVGPDKTCAELDREAVDALLHPVLVDKLKPISELVAELKMKKNHATERGLILERERALLNILKNVVFSAMGDNHRLQLIVWEKLDEAMEELRHG
jgi:hypothetical protein